MSPNATTRLIIKALLQLWEIESGKALHGMDVSQLSAYRRVEDIEWGGIRAIE